MPEIWGNYEQAWPFIDRTHDDAHHDDDDDDDDESMDLGTPYFQSNSDEKKGRSIEDASLRGMHFCGP